MRIERAAIGVLVAKEASVGAYKAVEKIYEMQRRRRLPEGGLSQSIIPFYKTFLGMTANYGMMVAVAGGLPKQALRDPRTEFDVAARQFRAGPRSVAKATLYRGEPEMTLRDIDARVKKVTILQGQPISAVADTAGHVADKKRNIQRMLDRQAKMMRFPRGPVLSLFTYEREYGHPFAPKDYATRTMLEGDHERLFDNNGNSVLVPIQDPWECLVPMPNGDDLVIPTDSPVTIWGRTRTRPVVPRQRDLADADAIEDNLTAMGLYDELMGEQAEIYRDFGRAVNSSVSWHNARELVRARDVEAAAGMASAALLMPLAAAIEESFLGMALRDPESPLFTFQENKMNVVN